MNRCLELTFALCVAPLPLLAAPGQSNKAVPNTSGQTAKLLCWNGKQKNERPHTRIAQSKIISSPDSSNRAYAVVKAAAQNGSGCVNYPHLFVATQSKDFHEVFGRGKSGDELCLLPNDTNNCGVNGIRVVQWSRNNRYLLLEFVLWIYGTEALWRIPAIYDAQSGDIKAIDADKLITEYFGSKCDFDLLTKGFSSAGDIVIEIQRIPPAAEKWLGFHSCSKHTLTAHLDWQHNTLKGLPPRSAGTSKAP